MKRSGRRGSCRVQRDRRPERKSFGSSEHRMFSDFERGFHGAWVRSSTPENLARPCQGAEEEESDTG